MDTISVYKGFMKMVDTLNKFKSDTFNFSKGVFTTYHEGIMTILTFTEKIEKGITDFFPYVFDISPAIFKFMDKHFEICEIEFNKKYIEFMYNCKNESAMYSDKSFEKMKGNIYRDKNFGYFCVKIIIEKSDNFDRIVKILNSFEDLDFSESKEFKLDIYNDIANSEIPLIIEDDKFFTRLSKSVFQNVTKGDKAICKCIPYNDNSTVFLTTTTVDKSEYKIINVFNVLYLNERDE